MKLGIILAVTGFLGTVLTLSAYVIFPIAVSLAETPWPLVIGVCFFIVFVFGMRRVRKNLKQRRLR